MRSLYARHRPKHDSSGNLRGRVNRIPCSVRELEVLDVGESFNGTAWLWSRLSRGPVAGRQREVHSPGKAEASRRTTIAERIVAALVLENAESVRVQRRSSSRIAEIVRTTAMYGGVNGFNRSMYADT
ncbi:hypothetical protein QE152_g6669 [Popillia japonica]|uniref:Uncharacterized protein n=1 Tax=Popillia japonica TaxID=7064 RepID=A0AAW1MEI3_POPJA